MKKIIFAALFLCSTLAFAQDSETTEQAAPFTLPDMEDTNEYLVPDLKTLKYQITIREDHKDIFKSSFNVRNGQEFIILSKQAGKQDKEIDQKGGAVNQKEILSSLETKEKETANVEQLKLTANIGRNQNIFSQVSWQIVNLESNKKMALLSTENKALVAIVNPVVLTNKNMLLVAHQKNEETLFFLNNKEIVLKAYYK